MIGPLGFGKTLRNESKYPYIVQLAQAPFFSGRARNVPRVANLGRRVFAAQKQAYGSISWKVLES